MSLDIWTKYIPKIEEIKEAESMLTDEQKEMSQEREESILLPLKEQLKAAEAECAKYPNRFSDVGRHWREIAYRDKSKAEYLLKKAQDSQNEMHYNSVFDNMSQKEYVERLIKDLPDNTLVATSSTDHCNGSSGDAIITVGEIRQSIRQAEEIAQSEIDEFEKNGHTTTEEEKRDLVDRHLRFGEVNCGYHDYDDMCILGEVSDSVEENLSRFGNTICYEILMKEIAEEELMPDIKYKVLSNGVILVKDSRVIKLYEENNDDEASIQRLEWFRDGVNHENTKIITHIEQLKFEIIANEELVNKLETLKREKSK